MGSSVLGVGVVTEQRQSNEAPLNFMRKKRTPFVSRSTTRGLPPFLTRGDDPDYCHHIVKDEIEQKLFAPALIKRT